MKNYPKEPVFKLDWPENDWDKAATELASGTIVRDWVEDGLRCIIMRGPASFNAYIGLPESHPLAGKDYDNIPVDCHGGLTFSQKGDGPFPVGYWWYGWDYTHLGDRSFYDLTMKDYPKFGELETAWTIKMIKENMWSTLYDFKKLIKLVEEIHFSPESIIPNSKLNKIL